MTSPAPVPDNLRRPKILRIAYWTLPSLFCLALYFRGILAWYQQDDFVWLGQRLHIAGMHDFLHAVFGPSVHGTFRPFSERLFLLIAAGAFGTDALPARLVVFLTQIASLLVLSSVARRVFQSDIAGFLAPVLWVANAAIAFPMTWSSSYMYILCGLCILLAFRFFLSYIDTGKPVYHYLQWTVFLFGFGVMETMIVYPALAATYSFLAARKYFVKTLPLFGASLAFLVFHTLYVPKEHVGTYSLHFGVSLFHSLLTYWKWGLVPDNWLVWYHWQGRNRRVIFLVVLFTAAIVGHIVCCARRGNRKSAFGLAAFFILLAPVLPLTEHVSYYYLTLPAMGLALIGASAAASAANAGTATKVATALVLGLFLAVEAPVAAWSCNWWYVRSLKIREVLLDTVALHRTMPQKTLVLTGVDEDVFSGIFWDNGFQTFGAPDVYVDPGQRSALIASSPDADIDLAPFFLDPADLQRGLLQHRVAVLSVASGRAVEVTPQFEAAAQAAPPLWPRRVDVSSVSADGYLRGSWYSVEVNHRWMGKRAGVVLAGPVSPDQKLYLDGYCSGAQLSAGPLGAAVSVDGKPAGSLQLTREGSFEAAFSLPAETVGKPSVEVVLEVQRTFRPPGDIRDLGLSFGTFEIR